MMFRNTNSGVNKWLIGKNSSADFSIGEDGNEWLYIVRDTGNVGIGKTPNRSRKLEVAGDINLDNGYGLEWEDGGVGIVGSGATDTMTFATAGVERMRLTSAGYALLGRSTDFAGLGYKLQVDNDAGTTLILVSSGNTSTKTALVMRDKNQGAAAGSITFDDLAAQYNTSSDYRLKENIQPLANGLARVQQLNPVQFDWIATGKTSEGFIAHEAQEVFAEAVSGEKDGTEMQGMDYGRITPLLVKAIQEQQTIIESLEARITALES
jgi:hypothetical protein